MAKKSRKNRTKAKQTQRKIANTTDKKIRMESNFKWIIGTAIALVSLLIGTYMSYGTNIDIAIDQTQGSPYNAMITLKNSGFSTKVTQLSVIVEYLKHNMPSQRKTNIRKSPVLYDKDFRLGHNRRYSKNFSFGGGPAKLVSAKLCVRVRYRDSFIRNRTEDQGFSYTTTNKKWVPDICKFGPQLKYQRPDISHEGGPPKPIR